MNFKLTYRYYIILQTFIWSCFGIFLIKNVTTNTDVEIVYAIILSGVIMHMTMNQFVNNWYKKGRPLLLDWFRLSSFLFIIVNFFGMIDGLGGEFESFREYVVKKDYVLPAVFVVFIGVLGLKVGEFLGEGFWKTKQKDSSQKIKYKILNPDFFYTLAVVSGILQLYLMLSGKVGYGTFQENTTSDLSFLFQIVFLSSPLILAALSAFKFLYNYNSLFFRNTFIFYFGTQIIYGFLSGMKESIFTPIIIVLIPFLFGGHKISKKIFYPLLFAGILIYPLNDNYRTILNTKSGLSKNEAFMLAAVKTFNIEFGDTFSEGADSFSNRLSLFPYLIYTVENETSWSYYKNMDRYIYLPVAWILPRFVIPNKPKSDTGEVFNYMIRGWNGNSLSATTYGWAYFEGGYFYVLIIFILFGIFITYFQFYFGLQSFFGLMMYITVIINLLKVETDIYFLISGILQSTLVTFIFYKIFIKEQRFKLANE